MSPKDISSGSPKTKIPLNLNRIAEVAIVSALYVVLTYVIAPIGYGPIQFRVSEAMIILVAARPHLIFFVPIGCFFANIISPYGLWDLVFMPVVSTIGALPMFFLGKRYLLVTSWIYGIVTGVGVGLMLTVLAALPEFGYLAITSFVTTSQLIIMTLAFFLFRNYFRFFKREKFPLD
jgi:uncharacterized membrane protein